MSSLTLWWMKGVARALNRGCAEGVSRASLVPMTDEGFNSAHFKEEAFRLKVLNGDELGVLVAALSMYHGVTGVPLADELLSEASFMRELWKQAHPPMIVPRRWHLGPDQV